MSSRKDRLKKLVRVQNQLKAVHETRHSGFLAAAAVAEQEAQELARRAEAEDSLSSLFPEIYHQGIGAALARKEEQQTRARSEAALVATATVRTNMVEKAYQEAMQQEEREKADKERLDLLQQRWANARR